MEGSHAGQAARMVAAYGAGERELALELALEILNQAPGHRDALTALYNIRSEEGQMRAAEALVLRLGMLFPDDPACQAGAALFLIGIDDFKRALPHTRMLVRLAPESATAHVTMGKVFAATHRPRAAELHFRQARECCEGSDHEIALGLGMALRNQGRFDEAREVFTTLEADENVDTLLAATSLEEMDGKIEAATDFLDRAEVVAPGDPRVQLIRATVLRRSKDFLHALAELDGLEQRLKDPKAQVNALMEKGHVLDALGRHDAAFAAFSEFKRKSRETFGKDYAETQATNLASRLKQFFTPDRSTRLPQAAVRTDVAQPIFVVGFPRSGTTLVEQTLTAHSNIAGGGELGTLNLMAERMPGLLSGPGSYPAVLGELWLGDRAGQIDTLRDFYLNESRALGVVDPLKPWFTDKMPLNETHLGLISMLFPQSPVIHLIRHPLDVVLSVFSNGLTHGYFCGATLESAARHYALIADLVAHYRAVMPLRYRAVRYEDLVDDQDAETAALFDFIGEAYDPRVLDFHENWRPARTASYAQVKEKLYVRSRYRYRNYLRQLQPVIPILEPAIRRLGYTID